jgi:hypothetical protein
MPASPTRIGCRSLSPLPRCGRPPGPGRSVGFVEKEFGGTTDFYKNSADRVAADGGDGAGHFVDARFRLPHSQRIHPTTQARSNRRRTGLRSQRHRKGDRGETGRTGYRMHTSKNRPRWPYAIVGFDMMGRRHHVTMPDAAGMSDEPTHRERSGMPLGSQIRQSTRRNNGDDVGGIRLV